MTALSASTRRHLAAGLANARAADEIADILEVSNVLSSTEAGYLDSVTAGTAAASKALVVDANKQIAGLPPMLTSGRVVAVTASATTLALTQTAHAERIVVTPIITGAGLTITLPAATGTGDMYTVINNGVQTVSLTITALAGDIFYGKAIGWSLTAGANDLFYPTSADIKYTFNITTTGGDGMDVFTAIDIATDQWLVNVEFTGSGTLATGFA